LGASDHTTVIHAVEKNTRKLNRPRNGKIIADIKHGDNYVDKYNKIGEKRLGVVPKNRGYPQSFHRVLHESCRVVPIHRLYYYYYFI
jgi:hypothetical protein